MGSLIFLTSLFLILLILIQRGRGGGLAGALGGMGGQSAFGTKAGDLFTRITIGVAAFWVVLSVAAIALLNQSSSVFGEGETGSLLPAGAPADSPADAEDKTGGAAGTATILPKSESGPVGSGATPNAESGSGTAPAPAAPSTSTPPASTPAESAPPSDRAPAPATPEKE
jgi:preprotein translocase subunit SecG